ncbi:MAG: SIR2 family protein [Nitrososphaerota archaeon]|nr:SIR2 family protein [Nitrososphaerota archaeon]
MRYPVRHFAFRVTHDLKPQINKLFPGIPDPSELAGKIVAKVIDEVEGATSDSFEDGVDPSFYLLVMAQSYAARIAERLFRLESKFKNSFKVNYKVVLIVGAGLSFESGLPLSIHLENILKSMGFNLQEDNEIKSIFEKIGSDSKRDVEFKTKFRNIVSNGGVAPTPAHHVICKKFEENKIIDILCYNWDNLIEQSYTQLYGHPIKKVSLPFASAGNFDDFVHALWKLHGDVENLGETWVYPGFDSEIPESLKSYCKFLSSQVASTLIVLVVGCSEADEDLLSVLAELGKFCAIYRLGMDMRLFHLHDDYLLAPAGWMLPQLFL